MSPPFFPRSSIRAPASPLLLSHLPAPRLRMPHAATLAQPRRKAAAMAVMILHHCQHLVRHGGGHIEAAVDHAQGRLSVAAHQTALTGAGDPR